MSFTDLMSSGRGPGVIGMVLALIVLIGFGVLFMFAFDEGFQGQGQTIESVIAGQQKDIADYHQRIAKGQESLALAPGRVAVADQLANLKRASAQLTQKIAKLGGEVESGKEAVTAKTAIFEEYKDQYRAYVRGEAKGTLLPELKTSTGVVYKNVNIREVTAVGMQILHDDGHKRIPFEELSLEMRDYYQFDPNQKEKALAKESSDRDQHESDVAAAGLVADAQIAAQREKDLAKNKENQLREIAQKEAQIAALKDEVRSLQSEAERAAAAAASARAAGNTHINRSGSINTNIRSKQNRIGVLESEVARMKSQS